MCDYDGYDAAEEVFSGWRKARKEHRCFACRETIRPGDQYHITAQVYDGFATFKHCARCWAITDALFKAGAESVQWDLDCGVPYEEAFGAPIPEHLARLAFMTKDEAQAMGGHRDRDTSAW